MPRAKFIQMMLLDVFAICLAAAVSLLMMYSSVKAWQHTQPPHPTSLYNSSASAVCGVWLSFQIYVMHAFSAKFPQFQMPVILYSIFANVSATYAPVFPNMTVAISYVRRMLEAFLTGLAIATGTSFVIIPISCRTILFKQMTGYIGGLRAALKAHSAYFESLEHEDMFGRTQTYDDSIEKMGKKGKKVYSPEAEAIVVAVTKVTDLHGKIHGDIVFAKREFAIGYLGPDDIQGMFRHLRKIMVTVVGLSFVVDIFQRLSEYNKWNEPIDVEATNVSTEIRARVVQEWNGLMKAVHAPFQSMIQTMDEGLQHASYVLKMGKPPKRKTAANDASADANADMEATDGTAPGEKGFAAHFERKLAEFKEAKKIVLRAWCEEKGIQLPRDFFDNPSSVDVNIDDDPLTRPGVRDRSRRQLYLFLYVRDVLCELLDDEHRILTTICRWHSFSSRRARSFWNLSDLPIGCRRAGNCRKSESSFQAPNV